MKYSKIRQLDIYFTSAASGLNDVKNSLDRFKELLKQLSEKSLAATTFKYQGDSLIDIHQDIESELLYVKTCYKNIRKLFNKLKVD